MSTSTRVSRKALGGLVLGGIAAASALPAFAMPPSKQAIPYTGNDVFEILENDHHAIKHCLDTLIADIPKRHTTLMALSALFTIHNATEENYVYPAVGKIAKLPNDAAALFHQQDEAKTVVWSLHEIGKTEGFASQAFTDTAQQLLAAALAHVHQEETRDFPALRTALGPQHVAELTHAVRAFRQRFA